MTDLDTALIVAHRAHDLTGLVALYAQAAQQAADADSRAFFLTHAHVFALECGHAQTGHLRAALIEMGRESPL